MSENNTQKRSGSKVLTSDLRCDATPGTNPALNRATTSRHASTSQCTSAPQRAPAVMGILNVTPDSFSDGGSYPTIEDAVNAAKDMCKAGASVIDVGGESTRPGFTEVSEAEEISRTQEVVARLAAEGIPVSIDTRHPRVAKAALKAGAQILNDVDGFRDPHMIEVAAASNCDCIIMSDASSATEILAFWNAQAEKLQAAGVPTERIIVDPGFGFGKDAQQNAQLMRDLSGLIQDSAYPVLVGVSRKRFIGKLAGIAQAPDRDAATLGVDLFAARAGAAYVRVHNVKETIEGLATYWPLTAEPVRALIAMGSEVEAQAKANFDPASFKGKSFDELQYASALSYMKDALKEIKALPFTSLKKTSSLYVTEGALGVQNPVLNAVIEIETSLLPFALLKNLLQIEDALGRGRPHPRTIDLDLLWMEGYAQQTPTLTLPHPGIGMRHFVLRPLSEVIGPPCHFLQEIGIELAPKEERLGPIIKKLSVPLA